MSSKSRIVDFSKKSSSDNSISKSLSFESSNFESKHSEYSSLPVLIKNIQKLCIDSLEAKLINMLNTADDRLFDMSESSYNNAQFDAMRLLRVKREGLISRFKQELANNFKQALGKNNDSTLSNKNVEELTFENIALVKDDELEEDIATDAMVNKARLKNQDALDHIRIRIDTLLANKSIDQENNPLEPVQICEAFRVATQTLDLDIASLLIIYKLFDRSVIDELNSVYQKVNQFFIDKGILPDLKTRIAVSRKASKKAANRNTLAYQNAVDALPINESLDDYAASDTSISQSSLNVQTYSDNGTNGNTQTNVLSVIQQLLASQRPPAATLKNDGDLNIPLLDGGSDMATQVPVDTNQLIQALSNIQLQQNSAGSFSSESGSTEVNASGANATRSSETRDDTSAEHGFRPVVTDLRKSLSTQLYDDEINVDTPVPLGQFNEDMIDIVSMLFDFILDDENLQDEIKGVIARLQIPMLKVGLVDKTFFSNRRHPARVLLNELARAGLSWDRKDQTAKPMFDKILSVTENIIECFKDDIELFEKLLQDFLDFKQKYQQRSKIFERRIKEAEEGKAKTESARSEVNQTLVAVCKGQHVPEVVKSILKSAWSHTLLLEKLKNNQEAWARRVKVAKLLVWSVQPIQTAERLEKLTSRVPLLIKNLREGFELISFSPMDSTRLLDELENCHRNVTENARHKINQQNEETILRLPAIDVDNNSVTNAETNFIADSVTKAKDDSVSEDDQEHNSHAQNNLTQHNQETHNKAPVNEVPVDEIGFSHIETGEAFSYVLDDSIEINNETSQAVEQLRAGNWLELRIDGEFKRCKLAAKIVSSGKYIFVSRSGMKMAEFVTEELCQYLQLGHLRILDDEALFDRALESVISNLRTMKAQA